MSIFLLKRSKTHDFPQKIGGTVGGTVGGTEGALRGHCRGHCCRPICRPSPTPPHPEHISASFRVSLEASRTALEAAGAALEAFRVMLPPSQTPPVFLSFSFSLSVSLWRGLFQAGSDSVSANPGNPRIDVFCARQKRADPGNPRIYVVCVRNRKSKKEFGRQCRRGGH